ncbi:NAD synthetase [Pseudomonas mosselii]|uniref:NAD synthetase n=2 Tax=Pseudomonas mosselii TaxID=78327 RepID=A0A5R8Z7Z3_9PSED|nr:NAD synthetase [Pseudomonas mosselii]TLP61908.1 NAD synthetase [Pseudomonas mosselii]
MTAFMPNPLGNTAQYLARQRLLALIDPQKLFKAVDADPGIVGAGVVWIDSEFNVITLREFQPVCSIQPKRVILREIKKYQTPAQYTEQLQNNPRESRVVKEAVNTTLSCASAFIGWIVVLSGSIAAPFSAGTSLVLTYVAGAAAVASTLQCVNGGLRTVREVSNPAGNDVLDATPWYQAAATVLDGVSLLGVGASGLTTLKYLQVHKAATGHSWLELTKSLSRQQRKALTDELLSIKHPSLTPKQLRLQQASGTLTKRYTPTQINHGTQNLLRDSLGATLGLGGSSSVQSMVVGLYEEFEH